MSSTIHDIQQLPLTHQATIPEDYLDSMGHMNVMWYTHLFAHAMGGIFKRIGMDRDYFVSNQSGSRPFSFLSVNFNVC